MEGHANIDTNGLMAAFLIHSVIKNNRKLFIKQQLRRITHMTICEVLEDPIASKLLCDYLLIISGDNKKSMKYFQTYFTCEGYIRKPESLKTPEAVEELYVLCPTNRLKQKLIAEYEIYTKSKNNSINEGLILFLEELRNESRDRMENENDYGKFIDEIGEKSRRMRSIMKEIYDDACNT